MRDVNGLLVCESVAEVVDPRRTALLVVDVQNDYCAPDGALAREGGDISMTQAVVPNVIEMVDAARRHGVAVVWIQQTWLPGGASDSPAWIYMKRRNGLHRERCVDGSWGQQFVAGRDRRHERGLRGVDRPRRGVLRLLRRPHARLHGVGCPGLARSLADDNGRPA
jgi:hypothetical protein